MAKITICGGKDFFHWVIVLLMNLLQNTTVEDQLNKPTNLY